MGGGWADVFRMTDAPQWQPAGGDVPSPFGDALNRILGFGFTGEQHPYPRATIVRARVNNEPNREHWRCLVCLGSGVGDAESIVLGIEVHLAECEGDPVLAVARADLLEAISDASQAAFAAGWLHGVEDILLRRGGMWALLAEQVGWPYGYQGSIGWDVDLASALARRGWTVADLGSPMPVEPVVRRTAHRSTPPRLG